MSNVDILVENAKKSLSTLETMDQATIDRIGEAMAKAGLAASEKLAKMAVEETTRGIVADKIIKNTFGSEVVWNSIKDVKTVGIISENEMTGITEIADPVGVVCGVTPTTNPTSTTMFKILIALKARNPIIFAFHPAAQTCSAAAAQVMLDAALAAGAPEHVIQWIDTPSIEATRGLMDHPGVALVLATGGEGMVRSAYSTGKPALGVGAGNVPVYLEKTADLDQAVHDILLSKSFDNGMICASEQVIVIDEEIYDAVISKMKASSFYFVDAAGQEKLEALVIADPNACSLNADIVGRSPQWIAQKAGFSVSEDTRIITVELAGTGRQYPLSREKLSPVLAVVKAKSREEALDLCANTLEFGGLGHTAVVHSNDREVQKAYGLRMKANRIVINAPGSHGAIGIYNDLMPSLTLGCGSQGKNSLSENVSAIHLVNIKRLASRTKG